MPLRELGLQYLSPLLLSSGPWVQALDFDKFPRIGLETRSTVRLRHWAALTRVSFFGTCQVTALSPELCAHRPPKLEVEGEK